MRANAVSSSSDKVFRMTDGLRLPLTRVGHLPGPSHYLPTECGVLLGCPDHIALRAADLGDVVWRTAVPTLSGIFRYGDTLLSGPFGGRFQQLDLHTGYVTNEISYDGLASIEAVNEELLLVLNLDQKKYDAIDWNGKSLWSIPWKHGSVTVASNRFLITALIENTLRCVDSSTGRTLWTFGPKEAESKGARSDRSNEIPAGRPSVVVVSEDRVVVTLMNYRVFVLSLESGGVLAAGKPTFAGWYLVTEDRMYFQQPFGLSEFDHSEMKEVNRWEYGSSVEPLYRANAVTSNGFWLTKDSVIWTTMHGAMMGVSRHEARDGRRVGWVDQLDNAIMPLSVSPVGHDDYLYYRTKGRSSGLLCWRGAGAV